MRTLTTLANPKYMTEPMGIELWMSLSHVRMGLSPTAVHEEFSVGPKRDAEGDPPEKQA